LLGKSRRDWKRASDWNRRRLVTLSVLGRWVIVTLEEDPDLHAARECAREVKEVVEAEEDLEEMRSGENQWKPTSAMAREASKPNGQT